jgi:hypothetical protein
MYTLAMQPAEGYWKVQISKFKALSMAANWAHVDVTLSACYEVRNIILKLLHKVTEYPAHYALSRI